MTAPEKPEVYTYKFSLQLYQCHRGVLARINETMEEFGFRDGKIAAYHNKVEWLTLTSEAPLSPEDLERYRGEVEEILDKGLEDTDYNGKVELM